MKAHSCSDPEEKVIELLECEWAWARLTARWRLYRSGYHLHARSVWRRAHPPQRERQIHTTAYQVRQFMTDTLPKNLQSLIGANESDDENAINQKLDAFRQRLEAESQQRRAKRQGTQKSAPTKNAEVTSQSPAVKGANQTLTGRELAQLHEGEAKILAARTQEIGRIAQTSLLRLLVGEDTEATAFQHRQMEELRDELAPPGSRIEEQLLAEVIVKARFEMLLWQAHSADLIATGQTKQTVQIRVGQRITTNVGAISDKRAENAEKRYLRALRDLTQLRHTIGPAVQVNVANLIGETQLQKPKQTHLARTAIDEASTK